MQRFAWVAALALSLLATAPVAQAEKRIALLIGNQGYDSEIGRLANPHNDVALLETALKGLRFEVTTVRDAGLAALHQAVNAHVRRVAAAGANAVGFFYYSGHGAADGGTNYLIPVDVRSAADGELWDRSLRLTEITRRLKTEAGDATHFVVFDACRNTLKLKQVGTRGLVQAKGFVPVSQESGMLIAYATAEGELASDLGAGAGPYATVLAEEIIKPGIEAVAMFRIVQRRVRVAIRQEPYLGFSALGDVYLAGKEQERPAPASHPAPLSEAAEAWDRTKETTSIIVLDAFIERYRATIYADLARARIDELKRQREPGAAAPPHIAALPQPPDPGQAEMNPRQLYETAYGHLLQRDYGAAEAAFEEFVRRHPNDPLAGSAQYWLGESFYVRGQYRAAAGAFLKVYETYGNSTRGPESLLKLAMSLQRLGQKEAACSSFAELTTKFPSAPAHLKTLAQTERKRAGC